MGAKLQARRLLGGRRAPARPDRLGLFGLDLLCLLLGGCSDTRWLAWPEARGLASAVVVTDGPTQLAAAPWGAPLRVEEAAAIELLAYEEALAELGLDPGAVEAGTPCRSCTLATPAAVFELDPAGSAEAEADWRPRPGAAARGLPSLVPDHAQRCTRCPVLETELVATELDATDGRMWAHRWGDGRALLHPLRTLQLRTVDAEGELVELCQSEAHTIAGPSYLDDERHLWLALTNGRLLVLDLERLVPNEACEVATATLTAPYPAYDGGLVWLAGGPTERGTELYGLTLGGAIVRFLAGRWDRIEAMVSELDYSPRIEWLGPGRALALSGREDYYSIEDGVRLTSGALRDPAGSTPAVLGMSVRQLPRHGTIIGSRDHLLWRWRDGRIEALERAIMFSSDRVESVAEDGDGIFFTARNGGLLAWRPGFGYCPRQELLSASAFKSLVSLGPHRWALAGTRLYVTRPNAEIARCEAASSGP